MFQFTLPRGERLSSYLTGTLTKKFQFTLPRGERLPRQRLKAARNCFNSRSRVGSDAAIGAIRKECIAKFQFTLPRGERPTHLIPRSTRIHVSIHAPAWGATSMVPTRWPILMFQFTLPRGERRLVSQFSAVAAAFQFTLPRGERPARRTTPAGRAPGFNSRSRVGSDAGVPPSKSQASSRFNSRSRVGSDKVKVAGRWQAPTFQFTLPRGERPGY